MPVPEPRERRLAGLQRRRKAWLQVHLWLGLALGFWLAIIGLTGSVLTFYREIDEAINPGLLAVAPRAQGEAAWRPLAEVLASADAAMRPGDRRYGVKAPRVEGSCWAVSLVRRRSAHDGADEDIVDIFVDPYTARVTGERSFPAGSGLPGGLIDFIAVLHYRLLLGWETGGVVVGVIGALGLFSLATGAILWWPLTGRWRQAWCIKRGASAQRLVYDLHKVAGAAMLPMLLAVLLSGIYFNLPDEFKALVGWFSPGTRDVWANPPSAPEDGRAPIGLPAAWAIVHARYPQGRLHYLGDAAEPGQSYRITMRQVPGLTRFHSERTVHVDRHSGAILQVWDPDARRTAGETFLDWQWPLHSGQAFGLPGRLLVLVSGLALPLLFVTGVMRWLHKRRACRARGARPSMAGPQVPGVNRH